MASPKVQLHTIDDEITELTWEMAYMSLTLRYLLEEMNPDDCPIPLPNITGKTLRKIMEFCKYHCDNPKLLQQSDLFCPWDRHFIPMPLDSLFEVILEPTT